jgi:hypothetical protein
VSFPFYADTLDPYNVSGRDQIEKSLVLGGFRWDRRRPSSRGARSPPCRAEYFLLWLVSRGSFGAVS